MGVRAGRLNRRVALQSMSDATGAGGTVTETWTTQATVWAHVEPQGGGEQVDGQQVQGSVSYRITIRHRSDMTNKWRAVWDSRTLAIRAVLDPDARHEVLVLVCEESDNEEGV
jgi:SPP1 family predicted phage head-tail adaptor